MRKFKRIYIEITNICNLNCSFCPDSGRTSEFMNEILFTKILNDIKESSEYIYFHVKGEPLMHPQLERFLDICKEKGFRVSIATNGTLISKTGEMLLEKSAIRQISFSLHSLENEKNKDLVENYLENIFSFALDASKKTKIFIEFKLWNLNTETKDNVNEIIFNYIERRMNISGEILRGITSGKGTRIADRIFLSRGSEFHWPDLNSPENSPNGYCYGLKRQAAILVDGTVVPCCLDGKGIMNLGNINEDSFYNIINSERSSKIIRGFSGRHVVEELCRKCTYRDRFGF